jgi:hypothetical protein
MKLVRACPDLISLLRDELESAFVLIDVGCAFGIDEAFQDFGEKLIAYGFDANVEECRRLSDNNQNPYIHYVPGFVKLNSSHPFAIAKAGKPHWSKNPWSHLAVSRSLQGTRPTEMSGFEKAAFNLWSATELADDISICLDEFLPRQGIDRIDLCKIDVDGEDFEILHSLERYFLEQTILSVVIEVNYFGSESDTDHTFHNVDRYMRRYGFDLYGLTVNKYSARSLPARYCFTSPGENVIGRPYQGDALYLLDVFSNSAGSTPLSREQLLKLIAICALFGLPDWAAELVQLYGSKHLSTLKIDRLLEALAHQIQEDRSVKLSYADYMFAFKNGDPSFYCGVSDAREKGTMEELTRVRAELMTLKNSRSWRITAPLRFLSLLLRNRFMAHARV